MERQNAQDLRVVKTVRNIETTFIDLLQERDFSVITVQDILDRALINRKTFYRYYKDKYDLAETVIRAFFQKLTHRFDTMTIDELEDSRKLLASSTYSVLYNSKKEIVALWNVKTSEVDFYSLLLKLIQNKHRDIIISTACPCDNIELESFLTETIMLQTIKYFLDIDQPITTDVLLTNLKNSYVFLTKDLS